MAVLGDGLPLPTGVPGPDGPVSVYVRPHDLDVTRHHGGDPSWPARIARLIPLGGLARLEVDLPDGTGLHVQLTRERAGELALAPGDDVFVTPKDLKVFHARRGRRGELRDLTGPPEAGPRSRLTMSRSYQRERDVAIRAVREAAGLCRSVRAGDPRSWRRPTSAP